MNPQCGKVGLFKRAWNEIPEVIGASFMALIGIGLGLTGLYLYEVKDGDNRRYKFTYTVIRDDDPRAKYVRDECEDEE